MPRETRKHDVSKVTIQVESALQWAAAQTESGAWMAECEPLSIVLEGATLDELYGLIDEACHLLFFDLFHDDELDQFLHDRGWQAGDLPATETEHVDFEVPWNLTVQGGSRGHERRAH